MRQYTGPRIIGTRTRDREDGSGDDRDPRQDAGDRRSRVLVILALILGLAGITGSWIWIATDDARALRALPPPQRAQVLHNALTNLTDVCDPFPPRSLATFCREQAEIAASFNECDTACLAIARRHLNQPVR
jgi:hypothetical protein